MYDLTTEPGSFSTCVSIYLKATLSILRPSQGFSQSMLLFVTIHDGAVLWFYLQIKLCTVSVFTNSTNIVGPQYF